jgi:hypothetical protein
MGSVVDAGLGDHRDGVLVDQDLMTTGLDDDRETIESFEATFEPFAIDQVERHDLGFFQALEEKTVLDIDVMPAH